MKPLEFVVILLCVLLGLGRGADLAFATDAATGLCTAGAVWWRYLALGAVVLTAVLVGRSRPLPPEPLRSRRPAAGVLAFAGAVCVLAAGAAQFVLAAGTVSTFVRILLEVACAVWLSNLGAAGCPDGWKTPTGGLPLASSGQCAVLLERADALYGEQLQLAQGTAHAAAVWRWRRCCFWRCAHAVSAPAGKRPHPARCGACSFLSVPVLGTAPGASAVGSGSRPGPAAVLPNWLSALRCERMGGMGLACIGKEKAGNN